MADRWLIYSREHSAWRKPDSLGYTTKLSEAGIYDLETALRICCNAGSLPEARGSGPCEMLAPAEWSHAGDVAGKRLQRLRRTQDVLDGPMPPTCFRIQVSGVPNEGGGLHLEAAARIRAKNMSAAEILAAIVLMTRNVRAIRGELVEKLAADCGKPGQMVHAMIDRLAEKQPGSDMVSVIRKVIDSEAADPDRKEK